jgi:AraC-like DNA-binding protein
MTVTPWILIKAPRMTDTGAHEARRTLDAALETLRLEGALFFRSEFSEAWTYQSPPPEMAGLLRPGAERLIHFHVVAAGDCFVAAGDGERHWATEGDVIVLPYGDQHTVGGVEPAECIPILTLLDPPPWTAMPVLRFGGGGARTDVVCGYLHSDDPLFDPRLGALPHVFVVRLPDGPAAHWVRASIDYALAATSGSAPEISLSTRLPELLLIEVLRHHLASAPAADHGWIAGLRDPIVGRALSRLHQAPGRKWSVADLAAAVAVSRSVLDERFRQVLGRSPIRYLTEWRMHVARSLLASTHLPIGSIADRVGYDAEEAFSRTFKRSHGIAPGQWRSAHRTTHAYGGATHEGSLRQSWQGAGSGSP